jgi:nicotinamidase-related amidase
MALTTLDPHTALIVIDLQKGIVGMAGAQAAEDVVGHAADLVSAFRAEDLPVVLVNVAGRPPGRTERQLAMGALPPDWAELVPDLKAQPSDHRVTKYGWDAFSGTGLDAWLKSEGATQVVICGVSTSIGVESTARLAYALGYNVTLATDAMTDLSPEAHENSLTRIFPRLGESGSSAEIIALLGTRNAK